MIARPMAELVGQDGDNLYRVATASLFSFAGRITAGVRKNLTWELMCMGVNIHGSIGGGRNKGGINSHWHCRYHVFRYYWRQQSVEQHNALLVEQSGKICIAMGRSLRAVNKK